MKGKKILPIANDILSFIEHRKIENPLNKYLDRAVTLTRLQEKFEIEGEYSTKTYKDIISIDPEIYNLSLILSIIITNHRYEILENLVQFLKSSTNNHPKVLVIGFGTGYEIKLINDLVHNCKIFAFDKSNFAYEYASDLLKYFGYNTDSLFLNEFPLESNTNIKEYENSFDMVILCEVLEHLEYPDISLRNIHRVLSKNGQAFLTMAINIAQEDHVFLYSSIEMAKKQVLNAGFKIVRDFVTPVAIFPFKESERNKIFKKGNYICIVSKNL